MGSWVWGIGDIKGSILEVDFLIELFESLEVGLELTGTQDWMFSSSYFTNVSWLMSFSYNSSKEIGVSRTRMASLRVLWMSFLCILLIIRVHIYTCINYAKMVKNISYYLQYIQ